MITGLIGRKLGMTQVFSQNGKAEAATLIEAGPCVVVQVKTEAGEGYNAAQLSLGKAKNITRAVKGHCKGLAEPRFLKEIRLDSTEGINVGDNLDASLFNEGEMVNITGITKGRGFAGVVRRHGFAGGPKTHGQSDRHRAPGSIGSGTTPGRVLKGKKMAGHMGVGRVTIQNLEVLKADAEHNLLVVRGAVPGMKNGLLIINKAGRSK